MNRVVLKPVRRLLASGLISAVFFCCSAFADVVLPGFQQLGDNSNLAVTYDQLQQSPFYVSLTSPICLSAISLTGASGLEADSSLVFFIDGQKVATADPGVTSVTLIAPLDLAAGLHTLALRGGCYDNGTLVPCSGELAAVDLSIADLDERFVDPVTDLITGDLNSPFMGTSQVDAVEITGAANRGINLAQGDDRLYIHGAANGNDPIDLSNGDDVVLIGGDKNSPLNLGQGKNHLQVNGNLNNGALTGENQDDTVKIKGEVNSSIQLNGGSDHVEILQNVNSLIDMGNGSDQLYVHGNVNGSGVSMGGGADVLRVDGSFNATVDGGGGNDILYVNMTESQWAASWQRNKVSNFETIIFTDSQIADLDEDDFSFDQITLHTVAPNQTSDSLHFLQKHHLGDNNDDRDGYGDLAAPSRPYYPDSHEGASLELTFNLARAASQLEIDFYRLRAIYPGTQNAVYVDNQLVGVLDGSEDADLALDPYRLSLGGSWSAGSHVLRVTSALVSGSDRDDFSWDQIILTTAGSQGFCFSDDFNRVSLGNQWSIIKQENFTPQIMENRLVLTRAAANISSGVTLKGAFPARDNYVEIEFDFFAYGGSGADGLVLVLSDAGVVPVAGGYGGSLGYANRSGIAGFKGGWLGFGLDEFGNFSNPNEGRNGGPGQRRDSIAVRGHGDSSSDYRYLTGTGTLSPGIDAAGSAPAPGHRYRFSIDTRNDKTLLRVERDSGSGMTTLIPWADVTQSATAPENFRISLTASTGGSSNIHSFDNLQVSALYCGTLGEGEIDHFEFIHDGQGLTCASETVTLRACGNADCSQRFSGEVQVELPDLGWLNGRVQTLVFPASGEVNLKLKHTAAETVQLGVVASTPDAIEMTRCFVGTTQSCDLTFADAGFVLDFDSLSGNGPPSGHSCTAVAGLLRAVRKNDDASACVGDDSFADVTRTVRFWSGYAEPATGTCSLTLNDQALSTASPGTALALSFNGQAAVPLSLRYADAGSVHLYARYDGQEASQDAGLLMTGSTSAPVVFVPDHFVVTSPLDNATAAGDPKLAAGLPFAATVAAVCGDGTVTPNFAWPTQLSVTAVQPSGGRAGVLAPTSLVNADFSAGRATPDLTYSEVGNATLQAQAANYLGSGREISGSGQIGRFMPHHFRLTPGSLTNRVDSGCVPAATFTYLDEPLALTFILEAENAANDRTQNYVGAYAKFSGDEDEAAPAGEVYLLTAVDAPGGSATSLGGRLLVDGRQRDSGWAAGSADFSLRLRLARAALPLPPDGPFNDVRFGVVLQDADGVAIAALDLDSDGDGVADSAQAAGAAVLRQGRLRLVNAHGSELLPLALPVLAEYYNGTSFVPHGADSCTALALTDFSFVADPAGLPGANAFTPLAAGAGALNWTSGPGSPGAVTVTAELAALPWLQFDWNADASYDNPTARATFGIYKGSERIIYLRETTWR